MAEIGEDSPQRVTLDVDTILAAKQSQYKTIEVHKEIDVETDIGNLLASDNNVLEADKLKLVRTAMFYFCVNGLL